MEYPGDHCRIIGLTIDDFTSTKPLNLSSMSLTKGVVIELSALRKKANIPWIDFYDRVKSLCDDGFSVTFNTFKVKIGRLEKRRSELSKNKKLDEIKSLLSEPFGTTQQTQCTFPRVEPTPTEMSLAKEKLKTEELTKKLSKLSVRNVNKRIRRREEKIAESETQIKEMDKDMKHQDKVITKLETHLHTAQSSVHSLRQKLQKAQDKMEGQDAEENRLRLELNDMETRFMMKFAELEKKLEMLTTELEVANYERDVLKERVDEIQSHTIRTKHGVKFVDGVRQCCMELLSMNVASSQVEPVIRSVLLNIASIEVGELPKASTLLGMLTQMKCLAYEQLSDELAGQENLTLHSDGTSKFGHHYGSYQVSTETSAYSLGLCDMLTGSADLTLHAFKQIIGDLNTAVGEGRGNALVCKIKNTMSDRHIVQKNFNFLLEEYRSELLPSIVEDWSHLSQTEQEHISSLNNFFCGMHVLVGMADTTSTTLKEWENAHFGTPTVGAAATVSTSGGRSESGIVRLIRTTCKAMCKHANEQSGVYQPFTAFLKSTGIARNPLATFRGNRFNILFYDAGVVYYLSSSIKQFLTAVWQTPNNLLKAVLADISVSEFLAGCKALGLINKIITGPLWRVIESKEISILNMNGRYSSLLECLEKWSEDATEVVAGEAVLYDDFEPTRDAIFNALSSPSELDSTVQEILQVVFSSLTVLVSRLLEDHLPGGKLDSPTEELVAETKSVPNSNTISERDFAKLDRLLREKPNASTLSLEGLILFSNNKTASWLQQKSLEEREALFRNARRLAPEFRDLYKKRRHKLLEDRAKVLRDKQMALQRIQEKKFKEKEKLTEDIMQYGLWQSAGQVESGLASLSSNSQKLTAMKCQLDFRKKVLEQKAPKEVFYMSRNKKKLSVDEVKSNLLSLISTIHQPQPCQSSPFISSQESLVGKRIFHKWKDSDGSERLYYGQILSLVPGTTEWFNVLYDDEETVLSLNLFVDIEKGDLNFID